MKILLISPPTVSVIKSVIGTTGPPLGLAYIAAVARDKNHEVRIIDSLAQNFTFDDVREIVQRFCPDLVGVTATTSMIPDACRVAEIVKKESGTTPVVIGGPHASFVPDKTLQECANIDYVVRGEGEITFSHLLEYFSGKRAIRDVRGISFRTQNGIYNAPSEELIGNVDELPKPALDLLPMRKYKVGRSEFGTILTSRGCPYNCSFCSSSFQFGKLWRGHSAERVMEELKDLVYLYGKKEIEFLDDTFTLDLKRSRKITEMIKEEKLDIHWSASARANLFNAEIAKSIKHAGAHTIFFGIESGTQRVLNSMGKGITLDMATRAVRNAKNADLNSLGSFVIGFPDETREEIKETISFSRKLGLSFAQYTIATPYPGTRLWDYAVQNDLLTTMDWRQFTTLTPVLKLQHLAKDEILKWFQKAYMGFYLRPSFLLKDILTNRAFILKRLIPYASSFLRSGINDKTKPALDPSKDLHLNVDDGG